MIATMTAEEATEVLRGKGLRISADTLRLGILQGVFPFGTAIMGDKKIKNCIVYSVLLYKWIAEREAEQ